MLSHFSQVGFDNGNSWNASTVTATKTTTSSLSIDVRNVNRLTVQYKHFHKHLDSIQTNGLCWNFHEIRQIKRGIMTKYKTYTYHFILLLTAKYRWSFEALCFPSSRFKWLRYWLLIRAIACFAWYFTSSSNVCSLSYRGFMGSFMSILALCVGGIWRGFGRLPSWTNGSSSLSSMLCTSL